MLEDNKVRFEVNVEAAKHADLTISSRLLTLARIVQQAAADGGSPNESERSLHQAKTDADHVLTSGVAVVLSSQAFLIYDLISFRNSLSQDLMTQAILFGITARRRWL